MYKPDLKKEYVIFAKKAILFIVLVWLLDLLIGKTLEHFYFSKTDGLIYNLRRSIETTDQDILIFGSSRASHHYDPSTLTDNCHLTAFNSGQDGQGIYIDYTLLKIILKRYKPKVVILDFNLKEFFPGKKRYDRLNRLLPYYKKYEEVREIMYIRSGTEKLKVLSSIYPYNSLIMKLLSRTTEDLKNRSENGYVPLTGSLTENPKRNRRFNEQSVKQNNEINKNILTYSVKFLNLLKENKVKCYVFTSPHFMDHKISDRSCNMMDSICRSYGFKYFNFSLTKGISDDPDYFRDVDHMNDKGAKAYTKIIAEIINTDQ